VSTPTRPQRADARSNRARILDAAEEVFGRGGASASTEDVARLAGVGIGTVFRHFPAKAELLDAVLARRFDRMRERAEALGVNEDPARALFEMFTAIVSDAPGKIALAEALDEVSGGADGAASQAERASAELRQAVGVLLGRAQEAGAVRADIELPELYALLIGMSRSAAVGGLEPGVQDKVLGVVFDGLAAPGYRRRSNTM
jgi:AcrR family transcriptional regulator